MAKAFAVVFVPAVAAVVIAGSVRAKAAIQPTAFSFQRFLGEHARLVSQADDLYDREMAREKAGDCGNNAARTFDYNECLIKEVAATNANYKAFVAAVRAVLGLRPDDAPPVGGPTGTPPTAAAMQVEFDHVEAAWSAYQKALCQAAYHLNQGGTIAPSVESRCELSSTRTHIKDVAAVLGENFHR